MAKKRSQHGTDQQAHSHDEGPSRRPEVDPSLVDQAHLGNETLRARMGEHGLESGETASEIAHREDPSVARALEQVVHARLALHLDAADGGRLERRVAILKRSRLPDRDGLIDRLHFDESLRAVVDGALEAAVGANDEHARWTADAALTAVHDALAGARADGDALVDDRGRIALPEGAAASGEQRAEAWVRATAEARTPERVDADAVARLCRTLTLAVLLEDEEEEEIVSDWADLALEES